MMDIDFAFICDFAEAAGKLNAMGIGFDTIVAATLPYRHSHFSLVMQFKAGLAETGQKKLQVYLIDEDGADVLKPVEGQFNLPKTEGSEPGTGRFVMEFGNVEFKKYGMYSVRILVENMEVASCYFTVKQPPAGMIPPKPPQI
jgi:hypothetical protein